MLQTLTIENTLQAVGATTVIQQSNAKKLPARVKGDFFGQSALIKGPLSAPSAVLGATTVHGGNLWLYGASEAQQFTVSNQATFQGDLVHTSTFSLNGGIKVSGALAASSASIAGTKMLALKDVTVTGTTTIGGPLTVDDETTVSGAIGVTGTLDVTSTSSTTTITGNVVLCDQSTDVVDVKGLADFTNSLQIGGNLIVAKDTKFHDDVTTVAANTEQLLQVDGTFESKAGMEVNAATIIYSTTDVQANVELNGVLDCRSSLTVTGSVSATADVSVGSYPAEIKGLVTFQGPSLTIDTGNVQADSATFKSLSATGATIAIGDGTDDALEISSGGTLSMNAPFQSATSTITVDGSVIIGQNGASGDVDIAAGLTANTITQDGSLSATGSSIFLGDGTADTVTIKGGLRLAGAFQAPTSATDTCTRGTIALDTAGYFYVCVADDTWKRAQFGAW